MLFFLDTWHALYWGQRCHFFQLQGNREEKIQRTESKQLKRSLKRKDNIYIFLVYCFINTKVKNLPKTYIYSIK